MNVLLIFFAIPVAVVILAAIFETIINCPIKIAGITFAIFLVVTFAFFDATFLIATIVYTILAFITATIVKFIIRCTNEENSNCCFSNEMQNIRNQNEAILRSIRRNEASLNNVCNEISNSNISNNEPLNDNENNCSNNSQGNNNELLALAGVGAVASKLNSTSNQNNSSNCSCSGNGSCSRARRRC